MARLVFVLSLATTSILVVSGCGTIMNYREGSDGFLHVPCKSVYGGVKQDICNGGVIVAFAGPLGLPIAALFLADLPFSFVADTLLLPKTLRVDRERKAGTYVEEEGTAWAVSMLDRFSRHHSSAPPDKRPREPELLSLHFVAPGMEQWSHVYRMAEREVEASVQQIRLVEQSDKESVEARSSGPEERQ